MGRLLAQGKGNIKNASKSSGVDLAEEESKGEAVAASE